MTQKVYFRPTGLVAANRSREATGFSGALPLCGNGPFDFLGLEIARRNSSKIERRAVSLAEVWESDVRAEYLAGADLLDRLTRPRRRLLGLAPDRPHLMGVINVTPDSFSDGGALADAAAAIEHGARLAAAGAAILDIGGESTRPGSDPTPVQVELDRVMPVIEGLKRRTDAAISIDTRKAAVMRAAVAAGAGMINDITALRSDAEALSAAATAGVPVVLMHALGDPKTMQVDPRYDDVVADVYDTLEARIEACEAAGIARAMIVVDPGLGFGKTLEHNLALIAGIALLHATGCQVMLGASRKRFIGTLTGVERPAERVPGSIGAALAGVAAGVQLIRVHDVAETKAALDVYWAGVHGKR